MPPANDWRSRGCRTLRGCRRGSPSECEGGGRASGGQSAQQEPAIVVRRHHRGDPSGPVVGHGRARARRITPTGRVPPNQRHAGKRPHRIPGAPRPTARPRSRKPANRPRAESTMDRKRTALRRRPGTACIAEDWTWDRDQHVSAARRSTDLPAGATPANTAPPRRHCPDRRRLGRTVRTPFKRHTARPRGQKAVKPRPRPLVAECTTSARSRLPPRALARWGRGGGTRAPPRPAEPCQAALR